MVGSVSMLFHARQSVRLVPAGLALLLLAAVVVLAAPAVSAWTGTSSGGGHYAGKDIAGSGSFPLVYASGDWSARPTGAWSSPPSGLDIACSGCGGTEVTSSVPSPAGGGDYGGPFAIGFGLSFFGQTHTKAWVQGYGMIGFGNAQPPNPSNTDAWNQLDKDVNSGTASGTPNYVIQFFTNNRECDQSAPGRVFTKQIPESSSGAADAVFVMQFDGFKFWNGCGGSTVADQNWIQVRMYQTTNVIEIHYKAISNNDPFGGATIDSGMRGSGVGQYLRYTPYYSSASALVTGSTQVVQYRPAGVVPTITADSYSLDFLNHGPTLFADGATHTVGANTQPASNVLLKNDRSVASASMKATYVPGSLKDSDGTLVETTATLQAASGGACSGTSPAIGTSGAFCFKPPTGPNPCAKSPYRFQYTDTDAWGTTSAVTATLTLTNCDNPPVSNDDPQGAPTIVYGTTEDNAMTVMDTLPGSISPTTNCNASHGLLCNDTDPDAGETATLTVDTASMSTPSLGTLSSVDATHTLAKGAFRFTPTADACGDTTFTYKAKDVIGVPSATAGTVHIRIACANDPPTATAGTTTLTEDVAATVTLAGADPDTTYYSGTADTVRYCLVTAPAHGSVGGYPMCGSGTTTSASLTFTPEAHYCNGAPAAGVPYATTNDDSFVFRVAETQGAGTATATHYLEVACVADDPVGVADVYTVVSTSATVFAATAPIYPAAGPACGSTAGLLCNDWDPDMKWYAGTADSLVALPPWPVTCDVGTGSVTSPSPGGGFTFNPPPNFATCTFQYVTNDAQGASVSVATTVTINVIAADPRTVDDAYSVNEETLLSTTAWPACTGGAVTGVLCNDVDTHTPKHSIRVSAYTTPAHAQAQSFAMNEDGSFTYQAEDDFEGTDSFQYTLDDLTDPSNQDTQGTVTITVLHTNDGPSAVTEVTAATNEEVAVSATVTGVDPDTPYGDVLRYCIQSGPGHGAVSGLPACATSSSTSAAFTYTPEVDYCNQPFSLATYDAFVFRVTESDGTGAATATQYLPVACANDAPTVDWDEYTGVVGHPLDTAARAFLPVVANDDDVDSVYTNQGLHVDSLCSGVTVAGATLSLSPSGHFVYQPIGSAPYTDEFWYRVADNGSPQLSSSSCAKVSITIQNDLPPFVAFSAHPTTVQVGEPVSFTDSSVDPDAGGYVAGWSWTFGDGAASQQSAPGHSYAVVGSYSACLVSSDEWGVPGAQACRTITVIAPPPGSAPAQPPVDDDTGEDIADNDDDEPELKVAAMEGQRVAPGQEVNLSASVTGASTPTFEWRQAYGPKVALDGADSSSASFVAAGPATLFFEVVVRDGGRLATGGVVVVVAVAEGNVPTGIAPTVRVASDSEAAAGDLVALDGSETTAGSGAVYMWTQVEGPEVSLMDPLSARATFVMPEDAGTMRFALRVVDDGGEGMAIQTVRRSGAAGDGDNALAFEASQSEDGTVTVVPAAAAGPFVWDFGDGSPVVTSDGPTTHDYAAPGKYTITLTVADALGVDQQVQRTTVVEASASRGADVESGSGAGLAIWLVVGGIAALATAAVVGLVLVRRSRGATPPPV